MISFRVRHGTGHGFSASGAVRALAGRGVRAALPQLLSARVMAALRDRFYR